MHYTFPYLVSSIFTTPFTTPFSQKMTIFDALRQKVRTRKSLVK